MMESEYGELLYHTEVGLVMLIAEVYFCCFFYFNLKEQIWLFIAMENNDVPELGDPKFLQPGFLEKSERLYEHT